MPIVLQGIHGTDRPKYSHRKRSDVVRPYNLDRAKFFQRLSPDGFANDLNSGRGSLVSLVMRLSDKKRASANTIASVKSWLARHPKSILLLLTLVRSLSSAKRQGIACANIMKLAPSVISDGCDSGPTLADSSSEFSMADNFFDKHGLQHQMAATPTLACSHCELSMADNFFDKHGCDSSPTSADSSSESDSESEYAVGSLTSSSHSQSQMDPRRCHHKFSELVSHSKYCA